MQRHEVLGDNGRGYELVLDEDGAIAQVVGDYPEQGGSFVVEEGIPSHAHLEDVPSHVLSRAKAASEKVCYYDPNECLTCFCDSNGSMRCERLC